MSKEEIKETPTGELEQGEFKIKKKPGRPKKLTKKDEPVKLNLSKKEEPKKEEVKQEIKVDGEGKITGLHTRS